MLKEECNRILNKAKEDQSTWNTLLVINTDHLNIITGYLITVSTMFLLVELVYIYSMSVSKSLKSKIYLVTTTPPKRLDGWSWSFHEIFLKVSSFVSEKRIYLHGHCVFQRIISKNFLIIVFYFYDSFSRKRKYSFRHLFIMKISYTSIYSFLKSI